MADTVHVSADIFRDGHEVLRAVVRWREPGENRWREAPLTPVDAHHNGVRWEGAFTVQKPGRTQWNIQAWVDLFAGWRDELRARSSSASPTSAASSARAWCCCAPRPTAPRARQARA